MQIVFSKLDDISTIKFTDIRPLSVSWEYVKPKSDDQTAYEVEIRERRIER